MLEHVLCALILLTRIGDLVSTRLATPTLRLEANPIARRLGWKFGLLTLLACLVPYLDPRLGLSAFVLFAFVCYSNFSRLWVMRALGEERYEALLFEAARKSSVSRALLPTWAALGFLVLIGLVAIACSEGPGGWSFWIAVGLLSAAVALATHSTLAVLRLFRRASAPVAAASE
jgi:hypothetical protein